MAQLVTKRKRMPVPQQCFLLASLLVSGCGGVGPTTDVGGMPFVRVTYQGQPLGDVQVRLHESLAGPPLAQSISRQDGNAYFDEVPSPEPDKYFVTIESISDGGWILDTNATEKLSKKMVLEPLESSPEQQIQIPDGAVKQLTLAKRR